MKIVANGDLLKTVTLQGQKPWTFFAKILFSFVP
jgi:hypothetical protein